jgi:large subunit ribosomal protein L17
MRHGDKINNLGRKTAHRHALMMNLACALIENKRIFTTLAKAKALRTYVEPLITKSKEDSTHSRRTAFAYLKNKEAVTALFKDVAGKVADRKGGYTRIIKTGNRQGDAAEMAMIELVDFNEIYNAGGKKAEGTKAKTTRRSRGGAKKATTKKAADTSSEETKGE